MPLPRRLDDRILQELARLICGNDGPYYRQGWQLARFLTDAGWENTGDYDGEHRYTWILTRLRERRDSTGDIRAVLLRLCDGREYLGEPPDIVAEVTRALNQFLVHEGYKIQRPGGRPILTECDPGQAAATSLAPITLKATMDQIIDDPKMAAILQTRLDEAQTCTSNGCHLAALILLGSLLEGVLLEVTRTRCPSLPGRAIPNTLHGLLDLARKQRWIGADVVNYPCETLRKYRNLIHPDLQLRIDAPPPDEDTLHMSWPVVNAALNDLADSHSHPAATI